MDRACLMLLVTLLLAVSGCAMCSTCDDDTYAAFGGKWQRVDMTHGRVGSAFVDTVFSSEASDEPLDTPHIIDEAPELDSDDVLDEADVPEDQSPAETDETAETEETQVILEDGLQSVLRVD